MRCMQCTTMSLLRAVMIFAACCYVDILASDANLPINKRQRVDYSPIMGSWLPPSFIPPSVSSTTSNDSITDSLYCDQQYVCTPPSFFIPSAKDSRGDTSTTSSSTSAAEKARLTWVTRDPSQKLFNNVSACDALVRKGIKKILFSGDSYMRQIYAATLITLKGDYLHGSIDPANQQALSYCQYHRQFFEKKCGTHSLIHYAQVCDGRIVLDPILHSLPSAHDLHNHCFAKDAEKVRATNGTVLLWSFGNYNVITGRYANAGPNRRGVNNATEYQKLFQRDICYADKNKEFTNCCSLWLRAHFPDDENADMVKSFNEGMRSYFASEGQASDAHQAHTRNMCAHVNYVDVYNMTAQLALNHSDVAPQLTYDSVHWGLEVNLIKAQILINALVSM